MVATIVSVAVAASPVGSWVGKIVIDKMPPMPPNATAQQKQQVQGMLDQLKKVRINMSIKANKTFAVKAPSMFGQPATNAEGTWKQTGSTITLTTTKENGKPAAGTKAKPQDFTLSKDGKTISMSGMGGGKLIFTKQ